MDGLTENRRLERFSLELPTRIENLNEENKAPLELVTRDVCSGGAFFYTDTPFPVGTEVKVEMVLPLERHKICSSVKVSGSVIRTSKKGMAVSFADDSIITPFAMSCSQS